jgi:hypothetical protein
MRIDVIEFELNCPEHGPHKIVVPLQSPWPQNCAHCFSPAGRRELRRYDMEGPLPRSLGSEAWVG